MRFLGFILISLSSHSALAGPVEFTAICESDIREAISTQEADFGKTLSPECGTEIRETLLLHISVQKELGRLNCGENSPALFESQFNSPLSNGQSKVSVDYRLGLLALKVSVDAPTLSGSVLFLMTPGRHSLKSFHAAFSGGATGLACTLTSSSWIYR